MTFRSTFHPLVALAIPLFLTCERAERPIIAQPVMSSPPSMTLRVEISAEALVLTNLGSLQIDDLQLTTYPDPLSNHILLIPYSFRHRVGALKPQAAARVTFAELTNENNARLSDSTRKRVGACHVMGKVRGQPVGQMFVRQGNRFALAGQNITWGALNEPLLGPVDGSEKAELDVDVGTTAMMDPLVVILSTKGKAIQKLSVSAYPPATDGHTLNPADAYTSAVEALAPGETVTLVAEQFRNSKGVELTNAIQIGVLHVQGEVSGQRRERFVTRSNERPTE